MKKIVSRVPNTLGLYGFGLSLWSCLVQLSSTDSAAAQQNLNQRANPAESDSRNPLPKSESKAEAAQDVLSKI